MADTHINAYFGAADEALREVQVAQGKYQAALDALEAKKKEIGWVEPEVVKEGQSSSASAEETKEELKHSSPFKKK